MVAWLPRDVPARAAQLLAVFALATLAAPATARASPTQESWFQDDDELIFNTPAGTAAALDQLRALGVDRLRISVYWATVAPDSNSPTRPAFNAADPSAYPSGAWNRYDQVIELALARGMSVNLDITPPAPLWASSGAPKQDVANLSNPSAAAFAQFVHALATRYSGSYTPPAAPGSSGPTPPTSPGHRPPPPCGLIQKLLNGCAPAPPMAPAPARPPPGPRPAPLPRVDSWSIWNEPNQPGWLDPQSRPAISPHGASGWVPDSPRLYRGLVDAAYGQLQATGHGSDVILIGETSPGGARQAGATRAIRPLAFIRALYCLDGGYRPLRGSAATAEGCPDAAAASAAFPSQHPALFRASGYALHPYSLTAAPNRVPSDPDDVTIADLPRLSDALARVFAAYRRARPGGLPLYVTEFGYNSRPPNPRGVSPAQQAAYLNEAEYMAFEDPLVRAFGQFLLVDSPPLPGRDGVAFGYGATFQTGLEFLDGRAKPALAAYRLPIFLPRAAARAGATVRVWGHVRPAGSAPASAPVAIQYRRGGDGAFHTVALARADFGRGFFEARVRVPASGELRLAWAAPGGQMIHSRTAAVRVISRATRAQLRAREPPQRR